MRDDLLPQRKPSGVRVRVVLFVARALGVPVKANA